MNAVVISIGTELCRGTVADTNRGWLSRRLDAVGLAIIAGLTVPDSAAAIGAAITHALSLEADMVVATGGLGPTGDDLTAPAVAAALGLELEVNPEAAAMVSRAVAERSAAGVIENQAQEARNLEPHQRKQAELPVGSMPIKPAGTAPGFVVSAGGVPLVVLPGVPGEMEAMWEDAVAVPAVRQVLERAGPRLRRTLCFYGTGEPRISEAVQQLISQAGVEAEVGICARRREVRVDLDFNLEDKDRASQITGELKNLFADFYYSSGAGIEQVVAEELAGHGRTLAVGESCTGGLLGGAITSVPGSSQFFLGGVIAYHNRVKMALLRVRREVLDNVGAVSEPVAQQLALGVRSQTGADYGIGITGVAGPTGGTVDKPVGLVFICASSEEGDVVERFHFPGGREDVRGAAVTAALHMLHRKLLADGM